MSVWNSIGEFFLFRLLVDKFKKCITYHDIHIEISGASIDRNIEFLNGTINEGIASDDAFTDIDDNLTDDSISPENLDDLDIIMRNNNGDNCSCMHHGDYEDDYNYNISGRYNGHQDWNSDSYSQSFDDFHDVQDDYDMMDDDFS